MSNRDAIIILASVGTTVIRAKEVTYAQIQKELADYSGLEVLQVFTDDSAAHAMSEPDDRVYTVEEALERAIAKGYSKVIAVPVFMTKGQLYNELKSRHRMRVWLWQREYYQQNDRKQEEVVALWCAAPSCFLLSFMREVFFARLK